MLHYNLVYGRIPGNWHGRHCVFNLHVHLVFVAKYRRLVFDKPALDTLKGIFSAICAKFEAHYGGDGRRARPRTPAGGIPAQASGFGAGEQPQRSLQPGLKTPAPRHRQEILCFGLPPTLLLLAVVRPSASFGSTSNNRKHQTRRARARRAILPRPERRGLPRCLVIQDAGPSAEFCRWPGTLSCITPPLR